MENGQGRPWLSALVVALTPAAFAGALCFGLFPAYHYCQLLQLTMSRHGVRSAIQGRAFLLSALSHFLFLPLALAVASLVPNTALGLSLGVGLAALLHALVLAPFSLFVPAHLDVAQIVVTVGGRERPNLPSLQEALAQWDEVSLPERALLVTLRAVPALASALAFAGLDRLNHLGGWSFLIGPWAYGLGLWAYLDRLTKVYARTRLSENEPLQRPKRVVGLALVALGFASAVAAYGAVSLLEPTPMKHSFGPTEAEVARAQADVEGPADVRVGEAHVRTTEGADVVVETSDGGGAGEVKYCPTFGTLPFGCGDEAVEDFPQWRDELGRLIVIAEGESFRVYVRRHSAYADFVINRYGVRLDDGIAARLEYGLGEYAPWVFLFGVLLIALAIWLLGRGIHSARRLRSIRAVEELQSGERVGAMEGQLVGSFEVRDGRLFGRSGQGGLQVHLAGHSVRLRIPEEGVALHAGGTADAPFDDGARVTLIGKFPRVAMGLREASIPWPAEAQLLAGERESFAEALIDRAMRPGRLALALAGVAELSAVVLVWLHRV